MATVVVDGVVVAGIATVLSAGIAAAVACVKAQTDFAQKQMELARKDREIDHTEEKDADAKTQTLLKNYIDFGDREKKRADAAEADLKKEREERERLEAAIRDMRNSCRYSCSPPLPPLQVVATEIKTEVTQIPPVPDKASFVREETNSAS